MKHCRAPVTNVNANDVCYYFDESRNN